MSLDANDIARNGGPSALRNLIDEAANWASTTPIRLGGWRSSVVTAAALQKMEFPPIRFVVPGLIAEGLTILAGRPKIGKSWLAYGICIGVSTGREVLGNIQCAPGDVLYCALEDNRRRLQKRMDKLLSPFSDKWPARLTLTTTWRRLDDGGVDDIADWCDDVSEPRLVVLDTLAGVRPPRTSNESVYDGDYWALVNVHRLASERHIGVLILTHTRKMEADDPIDTISGSLGLAGCADTALVLSRGDRGTTLYVRGRDIEERETAANFDRATCQWTIIGEATEVRRSEGRSTILHVLRDAPGPMAPKDISCAGELTPNNVNQLLFKMVKDGEVVKLERGRYVHAERSDLLTSRNNDKIVTN